MNPAVSGKAISLPKQKINFPNLDGIRFICFFLVFGYHAFRMMADVPEASSQQWYGLYERLFRNGQLGVNFFFVLSGFLITYLLVKEKEFTSRIDIPKFYLRRILKIWPLFYATILIGFVVVPFFPSLKNEIVETARLGYYVLFVNNFDVIETGSPKSLVLGILWSVAVEEQFYLCWPLVVGLIPLRFLKHICFTIIIGSLVFRYIYVGQKEVLYFHTLSVMGDLALGGLFAVFTSSPTKFLDFITNMRRWQIALIYAAAVGIVLYKHKFFYYGNPTAMIYERLVVAICFGMIILEQNFAKNSFFKISRLRLLSKLGVYTYGLYCLHFLGIYVGIELVNSMALHHSQLGIFFIQPVAALAFSILLSVISYHFYEKKFLAFKTRFAYIVKE